jgi:hypothetical protein
LNGSQILLKYGNGKIAGIGYKGFVPQGIKECNIVYIGFPFETIIGTQARKDLMTAILNYFGLISSVEDYSDKNINPDTFELFPVYPNPFNPSTKISFSIPERSLVRIQIYDALGKLVYSIDDKEFAKGLNTLIWDASNLVSGVYLVKVAYNGKTKITKSILLK